LTPTTCGSAPGVDDDDDVVLMMMMMMMMYSHRGDNSTVLCRSDLLPRRDVLVDCLSSSSSLH